MILDSDFFFFRRTGRRFELEEVLGEPSSETLRRTGRGRTLFFSDSFPISSLGMLQPPWKDIDENDCGGEQYTGQN